MTFDLQRIIQSKTEFRRRAAALPVAEKLRILDSLRERIVFLKSSIIFGRTTDKPGSPSDHR
jgi:hypothetical protein